MGWQLLDHHVGLGLTQEPVLVDMQNCVEEILPAEACCDAKRAGKDGQGLEEACGTFSFPDFVGNVIVTGVDAFGNVLNSAGEIVGAGLDASGNILDAAGNVVGRAFDTVGNFIQPVFDNDGNLVDVATAIIVGGLDASNREQQGIPQPSFSLLLHACASLTKCIPVFVSENTLVDPISAEPGECLRIPDLLDYEIPTKDDSCPHHQPSGDLFLPILCSVMITGGGSTLTLGSPVRDAAAKGCGV